MSDPITHALKQHADLLHRVSTELVDETEAVSQDLIACLERGGTIFWCGNGGSASDALHLAAELVGRFSRERRAAASIALTDNVSTVTSVGNDYGFDEIFRRQVEGLVRRGDVLVAISTSGNSANVVRAVDAARGLGARTIGLLGRDGGRLKELCHRALVIPSSDTARIQEMHILLGHILCDLMEQHIVGADGRAG